MSTAKPVLFINDDKCRNSYSCVRVCPVNAIEVKPQKKHPVILPGRCIGCGLCFVSCSPHAIEFRDSREEVKKLLSAGGKTAALIAPSIASEFDDITDYRKFVGMIRTLGCICRFFQQGKREILYHSQLPVNCQTDRKVQSRTGSQPGPADISNGCHGNGGKGALR
jgi:ferredoxin